MINTLVIHPVLRVNTVNLKDARKSAVNLDRKEIEEIAVLQVLVDVKVLQVQQAQEVKKEQWAQSELDNVALKVLQDRPDLMGQPALKETKDLREIVAKWVPEEHKVLKVREDRWVLKEFPVRRELPAPKARKAPLVLEELPVPEVLLSNVLKYLSTV